MKNANIIKHFIVLIMAITIIPIAFIFFYIMVILPVCGFERSRCPSIEWKENILYMAYVALVWVIFLNILLNNNIKNKLWPIRASTYSILFPILLLIIVIIEQYITGEKFLMRTNLIFYLADIQRTPIAQSIITFLGLLAVVITALFTIKNAKEYHDIILTNPDSG